VFLKLCKFCDCGNAFEKFESEEARKAWLIRVTINESKNLLKSAWLRRRDELDESLVVPENDDFGIYEYVKRLKPKYRTAIYLHYYEKYSAKEIAGFLKISESGVTTQLQRAREQLKEMIIKEESHYEKYEKHGKQVHRNV
jgi:RNA polymerase sigma-70 factor (ECF subfamily)